MPTHNSEIVTASRFPRAKQRPGRTNYGIGAALSAAALLLGAVHALAQTPLSTSDLLQARIKELAATLQNHPQLKKLSPQSREKALEFVFGNTLFVMLHELGHATVQDLRLSVLGREEDAADDFAILRLLKVGTQLSHRILVGASEGWFYSDRRDRRDGEKLVFYDEHSLDKQRAYQVVCMMVGADPQGMVDLANETKLPPERQQTCQDDFTTVQSSWQMALKPHLRGPEDTRTTIEVSYGDGKGNLEAFARGFRSLGLLELVADRAADEIKWTSPFALEMKSCGIVNAHWVLLDRRLTICYELAEDFAALYRDFGGEPHLAQSKRRSK